MKMVAFDDVIEFAIAREEEAVKFYRGLQAMVAFKAKVEMLKELEKMEQGHIVMLKNIRKNLREELKVPDVKDLSLSEYLVEVKPGKDMSYQDIILIAMKREEKAKNLYKKLAAQAEDENIKTLFLRIAGEETKHKLHFERIYDEEILREN